MLYVLTHNMDLLKLLSTLIMEIQLSFIFGEINHGTTNDDAFRGRNVQPIKVTEFLYRENFMKSTTQSNFMICQK